MRFVGLDIGGANLKLATHDGIVRSVPFAMWKRAEQLTAELKALAYGDFSGASMVGVTLTAELADCFSTKAEGVRHVIEAVCAAFSDSFVRVWLTTGEFAEPDDAVDLPTLVAAANWHALATWAGRAAPAGPALLVDLGSTTTDVIPIYNGLPVSEGLNDLERLMHSELVYTGATRTPVCAISRNVQLLGQTVPLAAEFFATSMDVRLILNDLPDDPETCDTADGRPATRSMALNRLAHMLCCDVTELSEEQLVDVAKQFSQEQVRQIADAIRNRIQFLASYDVSDSTEMSQPTLLVSGSGRKLAMQAIDEIGREAFSSIMDLSQMWRTDITDCACAFAVARLVSERCLDDLLPVEAF